MTWDQADLAVDTARSGTRRRGDRMRNLLKEESAATMIVRRLEIRVESITDLKGSREKVP
ncbi:hypothetical protein AMTR_s00137p00085660 [Amborella trichopoda]|uniref:Uncharacterized protein n=1 Tax=Amborella trichopoda TaxID=13333 RepID=W1NER9_AMBTC|nr:hypothetical protein AMTR_s00137p00085660 [Amborella trichopoda]